jgi:hypothetical protein
MWPDWRGQTAVVIAAGGSARETVSRMPWRPRAIVVNRSHELAPWADVLYAADGAFWRHYAEARAFAGLKVSVTSTEQEFKRHGLVRAHVDRAGHGRVLRSPVGTLGAGGNSGFQAVNLAAQLGARRVVLIGFDFKGRHWHDDHAKPLRNPDPSGMLRWVGHMDAAAEQYRAWGVEIVNASPVSALRAYPRVPIEEALQETIAA